MRNFIDMALASSLMARSFRANRTVAIALVLMVAVMIFVLGRELLTSLPPPIDFHLIKVLWLRFLIFILLYLVGDLIAVFTLKVAAFEIDKCGVRNRIRVAGYTKRIPWQDIDRVELYRDYGKSGPYNLRVHLCRPLSIERRAQRNVNYWLREWSQYDRKRLLDFGLTWYVAPPEEILQAVQDDLAAARAREAQVRAAAIPPGTGTS